MKWVDRWSGEEGLAIQLDILYLGFVSRSWLYFISVFITPVQHIRQWRVDSFHGYTTTPWYLPIWIIHTTVAHMLFPSQVLLTSFISSLMSLSHVTMFTDFSTPFLAGGHRFLRERERAARKTDTLWRWIVREHLRSLRSPRRLVGHLGRRHEGRTRGARETEGGGSWPRGALILNFVISYFLFILGVSSFFTGLR